MSVLFYVLQVQATILTSCAEGDLEALRGVALESSQIISLVMNEVIAHVLFWINFKLDESTLFYVFQG